jgi:hypothetical protein
MLLTVQTATLDEYRNIKPAPGEGYNIGGSGGVSTLFKEFLVILTKTEDVPDESVEDESVSIVWAVEDVLEYLMALDIRISRTSNIRDYFYSHIDMVGFVKRLSETTRDYFGDSAVLTFELYKDPEISDSFFALLINDRTEPDLILTKIDRIMEEYEREFSEISGWLMLGRDYRKVGL